MNDDNVDRFIAKFAEPVTCKQAFSSKDSYWFASILHKRFIRISAQLMYAPDIKQFGVEAYGKVYDVTGNVTFKTRWIPWVEIDRGLRGKILKEIEEG